MQDRTSVIILYKLKDSRNLHANLLFSELSDIQHKSIEGINNSRKKKSANLKARGVEFIQSEEQLQQKGVKKNKDSFRDFWVIQWSNYFHYRDPRRRDEREKVAEFHLRKQ